MFLLLIRPLEIFIFFYSRKALRDDSVASLLHGGNRSARPYCYNYTIANNAA
jgi:hypothetical protein